MTVSRSCSMAVVWSPLLRGGVFPVSLKESCLLSKDLYYFVPQLEHLLNLDSCQPRSRIRNTELLLSVSTRYYRRCCFSPQQRVRLTHFTLRISGCADKTTKYWLDWSSVPQSIAQPRPLAADWCNTHMEPVGGKCPPINTNTRVLLYTTRWLISIIQNIDLHGSLSIIQFIKNIFSIIFILS